MTSSKPKNDMSHEYDEPGSGRNAMCGAALIALVLIIFASLFSELKDPIEAFGSAIYTSVIHQNLVR